MPFRLEHLTLADRLELGCLCLLGQGCPGRLVQPGEPGPLAPLGRGVSVGQFGVHSEPPTTLATVHGRA